MKKSGIVSLLLMVMMSMAGFCESVPDTIVMTSSYNKIYLHCGQEYVIYDNGGPEGMYFGSGARYVTIRTEGTGTPIHISVRGNTASSDNVTIYRAASLNEPPTLTASDRMWYSGGALNWDGVSSSGEATVKFNVINTSTANQYEGFEIRVWVSDTSEIYGVSNSQITSNSATISWIDTSAATSWVVKYGTSESQLTESVSTSQTSVTLTGLTPNMPYYCRVFNNAATSDSLAGYCMSNGTMFITSGVGEIPTGCVGDISDFSADYVICSYGHYSNPEESYGVIQGRHTAMTDTSAFDPKVGDSLRTVPRGESFSVRLGNDNYNNEAESIIYRFRVDASVSDMLLFKYAAVLQNPPSHTDDIQPRLLFQILREDGTEIDNACYTAEFVANSDLGTMQGWHNHGAPAGSDGRILWHDWTSVGVNLEPLDGQVLYIKLTTKDCNEYSATNTGRHFGYAYFTLQCGKKDMQYSGCGASENTSFTAPEGFEYFWHIQGQDDTLSTERTFVPQAGSTEVYECTMTFRGSTDNACSFTLTVDPAMANVYPHAAFVSNTEVECGDTVSFTNMSYVSSDAEGQDTIFDRHCNSYHWDFGDGSSSDEESPSHVFPSMIIPQSYTVTLTARLSDSCESQFSQVVVVPECPMPPVDYPDNVNSTPCSFPIEATAWNLRLDAALGSASSSTEGSVCNLITPLVGDLDDDGVPEIVCFGTKGGDGSGNPSSQLKRLLIYDGETHQLKHYFDIGTTSATSSFVSGFDAAPYGLVKLQDRTGLIVVACKDNKLRAFDIEGNLHWTTDVAFGTTASSPANHPYSTNVAFADFNGDGIPEVYVRGYIYNAANGVLLAQAASVNHNEGSAYSHIYNSTGTAAWKLGSSFASNLIGDDNLELLLGNEIHSVSITNPNGTAGNSVSCVATAPLPSTVSIPTDGHAQVADFNLDGHLDVFVSTRNGTGQSGTVFGYVWDVFNNEVSEPLSIAVTKTGKSMPLIADIDGDDSLEVVIHCGVPGANVKAYKYHADSRTFTHFWDKSYNEDSYSNGVTFFDFNQDGVGELLISDNNTMSIANGSVANVSPTNISTLQISEVTIMQYPVIADVDNDGSAEIVFVGGSKLNICRSAGDPWAPARPVWNQYMYDVVNVNKDLTIPSVLFNKSYPFVDRSVTTHLVIRRPFNGFLQQATNIDTNGRPYRTASDLEPGPDFSVTREGDNLRFVFDICNHGESSFVVDTLYVSFYKDLYKGQFIQSFETVAGGVPRLSIAADSCMHLDFVCPMDFFCDVSPLDTIVIALNDRRGAGVAVGGLPRECDTTNNVLKMPYHISPERDTVYAEVCQFQPYVGNGFNIPSSSTAQPGILVDSLSSTEVCGNTTVLMLTVNPAPSSDTTAEAYLSFDWYGSSYTESGTYTHTFQTLQGCDSVVTLHLTILPLPEIYDTVFYCGTALWHGLTFSHDCDTTLVMSAVPPAPDTICHLHIQSGADLIASNVNVSQSGSGVHFLFSIENIGGSPFYYDTLWMTVHPVPSHGDSAMFYLISFDAEEPGSLRVLNPGASLSFNHTVPYQSRFCPFAPLDSIRVTVNNGGFGVAQSSMTDECDTSNNRFSVPLPLDYSRQVIEARVCQNQPYSDDYFNIPASRTAVPGLILDSITLNDPCSSRVVLMLTVDPSIFSDTTAEAYLSFDWYGSSYTESGTYTHTFQAQNGCDSVVTLHLTILPLPEMFDTVYYCGTAVWRGFTFDHDGDTSIVVPAQAPAPDTIYHLHLQMEVDLIGENPTISIVDGGAYIEFDVHNIGATPFYYDTLWVAVSPVPAHGDSVIAYITSFDADTPGVLRIIDPDSSMRIKILIPYQGYLCPFAPLDSIRLTINKIGFGVTSGGLFYECDTTNNSFSMPLPLEYSRQVVEAQVCQNHPYNDGIFDIPASATATPGLYLDSITLSDPCSSKVVLMLTVNPSAQSDTSASACDSYTWRNITCDTSGTYTFSDHTVAGCDSVISLHLTLHPSATSVFTVSACDSYEWYGETYTESTALPTHTLQTTFGCDSVIRLNLTINHADTMSVTNQSACLSFTWHEQTYTVSGNYTFDTLTEEGCLRRETLHLTINQPHLDAVVTHQACDSYVWNGETYVSSGVYPYATTTVAGCDSLVTLHLTISYSYNETLPVSICQGSSYQFAGSTYSETGSYSHTFESVYGCDSVVMLQLTVNPVYDTVDRQVFCATDPSVGFTWIDGVVYYSSTTMPKVIKTTTAGCDSTVRLDLTIDRSMVAAIHIEPTHPSYENDHVCLFDATNNDVSRTWYLFDGTTSTDPSVCFDAPIEYDSLNVQMVATSPLGCFDTVFLTIPVDHSAIYVPNVFTPNLSQQYNNLFFVTGKQLLEVFVLVYTREGLLVASFDGLHEAWDGTHNDKLCPQGTYAYHIRYRTASLPDEWQVKVGTVTLLR